DEPAVREDDLGAGEPAVVDEHELVLAVLVDHLDLGRQRGRLLRVAQREVVVLDREDVREVVPERERELERDGLPSLVLDDDPVLDALADEAVPRDRDRVLPQALGGRVPQEVGRRVVLRLAGGEEQRTGAVDRQLEPGEKAGVERVQPARREREVPVLVADAEIRSLEDRDCHQWRWILTAADWSLVLTTSSSMLTWAGRVTANSTQSAMSSGVSASTPS